MTLEWETPKIDWTKDDNYGFEDLNRVEANTAYLARIPDVFYPAPIMETPIMDRTIRSLEFHDGLNRAEGNLERLKAALYTPIGWEQMKTNWRGGQPFDYKDAARLENNLLRLYNLINAIIASFRYCGEVNCGDEGVL